MSTPQAKNTAERKSMEISAPFTHDFNDDSDSELQDVNLAIVAALINHLKDFTSSPKHGITKETTARKKKETSNDHK